MPIFDPPNTRGKRTALMETITQARDAMDSVELFLHQDNEAAAESLAVLVEKIASATAMHKVHPIADDEFDSAKTLLELERLASDAATAVDSALAQATDASAKAAATQAAQEAAAHAANAKKAAATAALVTLPSNLSEPTDTTPQPCSENVESPLEQAEALRRKLEADLAALNAEIAQQTSPPPLPPLPTTAKKGTKTRRASPPLPTDLTSLLARLCDHLAAAQHAPDPENEHDEDDAQAEAAAIQQQAAALPVASPSAHPHDDINARLASQEQLIRQLTDEISGLTSQARSRHPHDPHSHHLCDAPGHHHAGRATYPSDDPYAPAVHSSRPSHTASSPLDPGYSPLSTNLRMQHSGAAPPTQASTTAKEQELLNAFANGGLTPSKLNSSLAGSRYFTKKQYISLVDNGASIAHRASWSSASFSEVPGDSRDVRIQLAKPTLLKAYAFMYGHEQNGTGIGLEHVLPLRAGQPAHDLSSADMDNLETLRVTGVTPDSTHFTFTEAGTHASGPLPSLPITNCADLKARIIGLCRFLKYMYDDSAAPSPMTANPHERVPACTLTQALLAVHTALESLTAENGEIGGGPALNTLVFLINSATATYTAGLRKLACRVASSFSSPSLEDRIGYRNELAGYMKAAFNPVIEQIYGHYDTTLRTQLLAGGGHPPAVPAATHPRPPTGHSTRTILNQVPRNNDQRYPCVAHVVFKDCKHPACKYEHDATKLPASSLGIMLQNCGKLLQERSDPAPSAGQEGFRA